MADSHLIDRLRPLPRSGGVVSAEGVPAAHEPDRACDNGQALVVWLSEECAPPTACTTYVAPGMPAQLSLFLHSALRGHILNMQNAATAANLKTVACSSSSFG